MDRAFPHKYVQSVSSRCVATYNEHPKRVGMLPIYKPEMYKVRRDALDLQTSICINFFSPSSNSVSHLATETLPWLALFPDRHVTDSQDRVIESLSFSFSPSVNLKAPKYSNENKEKREQANDETFAILKEDDITE
mmetsp:Transcript_11916/g.14832  ORF Transcript_11916/g.14832 Transcript_11916/m.14832 type:complete len:136 (-) Transcript_11916:130-537(-)